MKTDYETIAFKDSKEWHDWLTVHHADTDGVWMRIYKVKSGVPSITYAEALDEALCFGWIDGLKRSFDELSYIQKFTPRRKASIWSKRNIENIARLTKAGRMMPAGFAEVERAKSDGRWAAAYDAPSSMVVPEYLLAELHKNPEARKFFESLSKSSKYSITWQLQIAKTEETRQRRLDKFMKMLRAGEKPS